MPMMLELFAGTGSVGNVAKGLGYDVISLDRDMEAEIQIDIRKWTIQIYLEDYLM